MKTKIVPIKACAEVLPGFSIKAAIANDHSGTHQIILAKHLPEFGPYRYDPQHERRLLPKTRVDKYLVSAGNVLFMSRGILNRAVLIESVPERALASASFYILKPKGGVEPGYIAWCLNQEPVQARIAEIRTGAGTPFVPRADFSMIAIVLPPLEIQRKIAVISDLLAHERNLLNRLREQYDRKHRVLGNKILRSFQPRIRA
jgi:restriction endonuclease S subunit